MHHKVVRFWFRLKISIQIPDQCLNKIFHFKLFIYHDNFRHCYFIFIRLFIQIISLRYVRDLAHSLQRSKLDAERRLVVQQREYQV